VAPPKKDPGKLALAAAEHAKGATVAAAAAKHGLGTRTLERYLAEAGKVPGGPKAGPETAASPGPPPSPALAARPSANVAPPGGLLAEVDAALASLPDDAEARVIGGTLRMVAAALAAGVDPAKIPAVANGVRTLTLCLREMRGPIPMPPNLVDERLRQLDGPARRKIEAYTAECDAVLERRMSALRGWLLERLPPVFHSETGALLDGLFAPPEVA
jgi:hypothetical protein